MPDIHSVQIRMLGIPLRRPYKLSFGTVLEFNTLLVEVRLSDGREGVGDATILTGYTDETADQCWSAAREIAPGLPGTDAVRVHETLRSWLAGNPFTVTAFSTACDMALDHATLRPGPCRVPVLGILNATDAVDIGLEAEALLKAGYETIKVKVGWDVDADLARVRHIQRISKGRAMIRVDANQGYSAADGSRFAALLDPEGIELFEQACPAGDWEAAVAVKRASTVPVMLDESIFTMADVETAARLGVADVIKLKLMKLGAIDALEAALSRILSLGMKPVLGNGVATAVGCWMEACVAAKLMNTTGEMNGFLKQKTELLQNPLRVRVGYIELPGNYRPILDLSAVDAATLRSSVHCSRSVAGKIL